ncbi:hypothetical protein V8G54_025803 [Vigna mungo]|uniref:Uncharacterized protein n=1 Tax=Vigna mungo TaxID=3915 RepID=A0AAQ3RP94_VIGMU
MQASIACSLHVNRVNLLQSHANHLPQTTLRLKPPYYAFTHRSPSGITLKCNSQPQPLLNLCTPRVRSSNVGPLRCGISSNMYGGKENRGVGEWLVLASEVLSTAFPLWVSIGCAVGLMKPSYFNWVTPKLTIIGLNIIMLGMGMTLSIDDLRGTLSMAKQVLYAFALQYSVMPLSGFLISKIFNLPPHFAAGLILIGGCPGVVIYGILQMMTPFVTAKLGGKFVTVDASGLLFFQPIVKFVSPMMPPFAVTSVAILCGNAIAQSSSAILVCGAEVILATFVLHASGFLFGYVFSRLIGLDLSSSRTISTQVGMKNSILGVVLAMKHFEDPMAAVPAAVSTVCQSIIAKGRVQSHTNPVPTAISLKPHPTLTSTVSSSDLTLRCKVHPLQLLNLSTSRISSFRAGQLQCGNSSNRYRGNEGRGLREWIEQVGEALSAAFPLWVTIACLLGLFRPSCFNWVTPKLNIFGLTVIMLGMGMTLTLDDLRGALSMPREVLSGFVLQYSVMPFCGFLVSKLLNLPSHYAAGLILLGCCPGGTASNIITYLARGNVALSVIMTAASTICAVKMKYCLVGLPYGNKAEANREGSVVLPGRLKLDNVLYTL